MRVLQVIETLGRGGAEQSLLNLLPALRDTGVEVEVAYLFGRDELAADFEEKGILLHSLKLPGRWSVRAGRRALGELIRRERRAGHGGFVSPSGVREFSGEHGCQKVTQSLDEMAGSPPT